MKSPARVILAALLLCVCLALAAQQTPHAQYLPNLPLLPAFNQSQHAPAFQAVIENDTSKSIDISVLPLLSFVTLDGKPRRYALSGQIFIGMPYVGPGGQWTYTARLDEYMDGWNRLYYDKGQEAWHWQSPLTSGMHTIILHMNGRQYGPAAFYWDAAGPFVAGSGTTLAPPSLSLVPAFDQSQHAPEFLATYKNNTSRTVDIYEMYTHSTITLDGKQYPYQPRIRSFLGNPQYAPGRQWPYTVDISDYVPGWKRLAYDKAEEAWHWQSPLKTGTHTLTLNMGGKQYGPVDFQWDEDRPFVIHSGANLAPTPLRTAATVRHLPR